MTLLLAQPETVTDLWRPLAKAINRFLWRWSPWHLRDTLRKYGYARHGDYERLTVSYCIDQWRMAIIPPSQMPSLKQHVERDLAHRLTRELIKSDAIRRTEEVLPHDLSRIVRLEVAVLKPWRP